ncbi:hypothetical protein EAF04_004733 [Stromatinia cepivora]|nr:hypothetical protein EAF04_004733 [Stromatinia cepivora]
MFFYPPSRWSNDDIESQISQHSSIQNFHVPVYTRRRTDDVENQQSTHNGSIQNPYASSLCAFGDLENQYSSTRSFERHSSRGLSDVFAGRHRRISNPQNQHPVLVPEGHFQYRANDLENQYSNTRSLAIEHHLQHDLSYVSTGRHRKTSDPEIQHPTPRLFEHGGNDLENQYSNTRSFAIEHHPERNVNHTFTQRYRRTSNPETQYPNIQTPCLPTFQNDYTVDDIESQYPRTSTPRSRFFPLQPRLDIEPSSFESDDAYARSNTPLISKMLDFLTTKLPNISPVSLTRNSSSPFDVDNANGNANKKMWQCLPNASWEDLEGGKLGCYHWNHEDVSVCYSCKEERVREGRSRIGGLKRALGFGV